MTHAEIRDGIRELETIVIEKNSKEELVSKKVDSLLTKLETLFDEQIRQLVPIIKRTLFIIDKGKEMIESLNDKINRSLSLVEQINRMNAENLKALANNAPIPHSVEDLDRLQEEHDRLNQTEGKKIPIPIPVLQAELEEGTRLMQKYFVEPKKKVVRARFYNSWLRFILFLGRAMLFIGAVIIAFNSSELVEKFFGWKGVGSEIVIAIILLFTSDRLFDWLKERAFYFLISKRVKKIDKTLSQLELGEEDLAQLRGHSDIHKTFAQYYGPFPPGY